MNCEGKQRARHPRWKGSPQAAPRPASPSQVTPESSTWSKTRGQAVIAARRVLPGLWEPKLSSTEYTKQQQPSFHPLQSSSFPCSIPSAGHNSSQKENNCFSLYRNALRKGPWDSSKQVQFFQPYLGRVLPSALSTSFIQRLGRDRK